MYVSRSTLLQLLLQCPNLLILLPILIRTRARARVGGGHHLRFERVDFDGQLTDAIRLRGDGAVLLLEQGGDVLQGGMDRFGVG